MTASQVTSTKKSPGKIVATALTLFFVTIYAPFTVSSMLAEPAHESAQYLVMAALLSMAVGTLLSAALTHTVLVLAPAIGMTLIIKNLVTNHYLSFREALAACALSGIFTLIFTIFRPGKISGRYTILRGMPDPIKLGIKGGVGALLSSTAFESFEELTGLIVSPKGETAPFASEMLPLLGCSVAAIGLLFIADLWLKRAEKRSDMPLIGLTCALARSATAIVGFAMAGISYWLGTWTAGTGSTLSILDAITNSAHTVWAMLTATAPSLFCGSANTFQSAFPTAVLLLFIFLTDIPGTPYEMLTSQGNSSDGQPSMPEAASGEPREVRNSFFADGIMAIIGPLLRVSPSIYYSENMVLAGNHETTDLKRPAVAILCAVFYLAVLLAVSLAGGRFGVDQFRTLSLAAVSPILFYIGIRVVANAMVAEHEGQSKTPGAIDKTSDKTSAVAHFIYYLPAATAVILTPIKYVNFQLAVPISIIVYSLCSRIVGAEQLNASEHDVSPVERAWVLFFLTLGSIFIVLMFLGISLQSQHAREDICVMQPLTATN